MRREGPSEISDAGSTAGRRRPCTGRWMLLLLASSCLALPGCAAEDFGPQAKLCARLVRFHLALHHPVEVRDAEKTPDKPRVRILYKGTRSESSSNEGTAVCRFSEQTGALGAVGASIDGERLETRALSAFNRFLRASRSGSGR